MIDPSKEVCGNCTYCKNAGGGQLECWMNPPTPLGAPVMSPPIIPGGPPRIDWLVKSVRAPTRIDWTCGYFEAKAEIKN